MDVAFLIINTCCYFSVFFFMKRKYGINNTGVIYMLFYALLSGLSIHLYITQIPNIFSWNNINFFALIYQLFFIALFCNLLAKVDKKNVPIVHPPVGLMNIIYYVVIVISLLDVVNVIEDFSKGMFLLVTDENYGNELYRELTDKVYNSSRGGVRNYISAFANLTKAISPLLLLYYLTKPDKKLIITIGLALASLMTIMSGISAGSRNAIVQQIMNISGFMLFMRHYYSKRVSNIIKPIALTIGGIVVAGVAFISISRANKDIQQRTVFEITESYTSQSFLFWGSHGFSNGEIRNGDRIIPFVKSIFVTDVARSYADRVDKYKRMKINEKVFVSFVGDCVFDFGIIGGTIFLFFLYLLLKSFIIPYRSKMKFYKLVIVYLLIWLLNGFYAWPFSDFHGNMILLLLLLTAFFFKTFVYGNRTTKQLQGRNTVVNL